MKPKHYLQASYLLFIALMIGVELAVGALSAPVIFNASAFITTGKFLTLYESGQIATELFLRFDVLLVVFTVVVFLTETFRFYVQKKRDIWSYFIKFGVIITAGVFLYASSEILALQNQGEEAITSKYFNQIHVASIIDIKILMLLQIVLFFRQFYNLLHSNQAPKETN